MTGEKVYRLLMFQAALLLSMNLQAVAQQLNMLSVSAADSAVQAAPRPVLVLLSTDWCKYCRMQKNQILKNKDFQNAAAALFYYVGFNAESKEDITFNGRRYRYKATGVSTGLHELAVALNGSDAIVFPTWVLLDEHYEVLFRHSGVLSPKQLKEMLVALKKPDETKK